MFRLVSLVALSLMPPGNPAAANDGGIHTPGVVTLEQVDVERTEDPSADAAYLTIWNGADQDVVVTNVSMSGYEGVDIVGAEEDEVLDQPADQSLVTIPARTEISMSDDTLFLRAARGRRSGDQTAVTVSLSNGRRITTLAVVRSSDPIAEANRHDGD
ncbi:copper chaperone PCu(A)C [Rhizobium sp. BK008]|uniref:copper chaperone PCu(A)C n=1 Tax=Rhizobium sp. BK008 TaxID=2587094 RepID=UPI0016217C88|nr:copper chaperone PCu(A)C [Rhizobium sp. BK008]MBB4249436.1 copper(I)-binding protein [Rhizobium sp. BK008]